MSNNHHELKDESEEKLMEAKVFLSEARYTNINVNGLKDKIRKAVEMKKQKNYQEAIEHSEDAIEQANVILDMYEKLRSRKKKLINLKKNGVDSETIFNGINQVKKWTDQGKYKKANEKLNKISSKIDEIFDEINKGEKEETIIEEKALSKIPEDGITVYSLKNELEDLSEQNIDEVVKNLEDLGYLEIKKKGRWNVINLTGKEFDVEEFNENLVSSEVQSESELKDSGLNVESDPRVKLEITLEEKEYRALENIWKKIFLKNLDKETIDMLGWGEKDDFFKDIFFYGLHSLEDSPTELINNKILSEFRYLKDDGEKKLLESEFRKELDNLDD